jgi:hypothetical protein
MGLCAQDPMSDRVAREIQQSQHGYTSKVEVNDFCDIAGTEVPSQEQRRMGDM